jgi:saccharopepsin
MDHQFYADTLLVDTGSSNTWIGASKPYVKSSMSQDTGGTFVSVRGFYLLYNCNYFQGVSYAGNTQVSGEEYLDTITLNSDLVIKQQSIGVANSNAGLGDLDGILGLGPVDLTKGTVSNANEVPTVTDNLYAQGEISSEVLGVFFSPASADDTTGELTFGGYDASKFTGNINYVPVTSTSPASEYWGVDQSISYGAVSILSETAGIVDTGTTLILIATGRHLVHDNEILLTPFRCPREISTGDRCHL